MSKGPIKQKPKNGPKRQRIKAYLKDYAQTNAPKLIPFMVLALDFLDDGQINGSLLTGLVS